MKKDKVVIIYSGGMDSTVLLYKLVANYGARNVLALSFNYQSKHNDREFRGAVASCSKLGVKLKRISLANVSKHLKSNLLKTGGKIPQGHYEEESMKKTVVPFRNGIMLAIACGIAESHGAKYVAIGNHAGDHAVYPDCRATFVDSMNEAMAYGTYLGVNILSPFKFKSKADIALLGETLGVHWQNTYSCYNGGALHCGKCSTCFERREAFDIAKVYDPTPYMDLTPFKKLKAIYAAKLKKSRGKK